MRTILLLLSVLLTYCSWAQEATTALNTVSKNHLKHEFEIGEQTYLLADNVNVRARPSSQATVSTNLPIGTPITILNKTNQSLSLRGFQSVWYEVLFKANKGITRGFVWGGLIALGSFPSIEKDLLFLYGIERVTARKEDEDGRLDITMQIRACKNNQEVGKVNIPSVGTFNQGYHSLSNYGNRGLPTIIDALEYKESQEYCGGENPTTVIFWDGKKLHKVITLNAFSDPPAFAFQKMIYPNDKDGVAYRLIVEEMEGWYNQDKEEVIEVHKKTACVWIKDELEEFKVLLDKKSD